MSFDKLPEEEQQRVAAQVDYFIEAVLRRYGMTESDIPALVDAIRYFREHKEFVSRVKVGGTLSIIGLSVAAIGSAVWQGVRALLGGKL